MTRDLKAYWEILNSTEKKERVKWATPFLYSFMVDPVHKLSFKPDYVVPIPVSAKKRVIRGYNQVDLLFKNWASWLGWYWLDCLEKIDSTQAMFSLGRVERKANMVNAFKAMEPLVKSGQLEGKSILLVEQRCLRLIQNFKRCA